MNRAIGAFVMLSSFVLMADKAINTKTSQIPQTAACGVMEEAMKDVRQLKAGMTRLEVESKFGPDGA